MSNIAQLFPDKKERTDFWIAITVVLLFLAAIIYYLFGPQKMEDVTAIAATNDPIETSTGFEYSTTVDSVYQTYDANTGEEEDLTELVVAVEQDSAISKSESVSSIKNEEVEINETKRPIVEEKIKEEVKEELPVYVDEEDEEGSVDAEKTIEVEKEIEQLAVTVEVETKEEPVVESEIATPIVKEEVKSNNRFELEKDEQISKYGCIVIVGSFKEPSNAKLVANQLEKQNYPVYEGIYKGYYIVGVNSSCEKSKVVPILNKMKSQYEKSAWIYKR